MKNLLVALSLLLVIFLTGCENTENQAALQSDAVNTEETTPQSEAVNTEETTPQSEAVNSEEAAVPRGDENPAGEERLLHQEEQKGCVIQEDESYIYICGSLRLVKIDKETGKSETLWENTEVSDESRMFLYFQGSGLLVDDKIYFIEESVYGVKSLSVIHTDGTGYQKIAESVGRTMLLQDGILYVANRNSIVCYKVYEDGTLSEALNREEPEGTKIDYYDNGYRVLLVPESVKKFGYAIYGYNVLEEKYKLTKVIPETGEMLDMSQFGNYYEASNSRYLLISAYGGGSYLVDAETLEGREFADCSKPDSGTAVITMDEDYVYTESEVSEEGQIQHVYEKISIETGERSVICKREESKIWQNDIIDTVVKNGYLYYAKEVDYNLYLMRRSLENPSKEEMTEEALYVLYDSGISEVGTMEVYCEELTGKIKDLRLNIEIDLKWLQVDDRFPGAVEINEYLTEVQRRNIAYEKEFLEEPQTAEDEGEGPEGEAEENVEECIHFSYTSEFSEISYFDNLYLSFCQSDDNYQGGMAHGTLSRTGYTFDLQTGDRLGLEDVIANSEEELKDIVTRHFEEMILANPDPGYYWEDALDTVREGTDLESSFYLTEQGIRFYFGPYALACFAAGFQEVTIPYEEFEMKIPVG